jgi:hypothetical protein
MDEILDCSGEPLPDPSRVGVQLVVTRLRPDGSTEPVATTAPPAERQVRDLKRVAKSPAQVHLRMGDTVRLEVRVRERGYVAVFNVGPSDNVNLLYPLEPSTPEIPVEPEQPLHVLDIEVQPPAGRERIVAVWSCAPLPLSLAELQELALGQEARSVPHRATRGLGRVEVEQAPRPDWCSVNIEIISTDEPEA